MELHGRVLSSRTGICSQHLLFTITGERHSAGAGSDCGRQSPDGLLLGPTNQLGQCEVLVEQEEALFGDDEKCIVQALALQQDARTGDAGEMVVDVPGPAARGGLLGVIVIINVVLWPVDVVADSPPSNAETKRKIIDGRFHRLGFRWAGTEADARDVWRGGEEDKVRR